MHTSVSPNSILTGSIPQQLLLFFLPIWFGTLFQQLYNTADTLIVGNFVGTQALAAVGATGAFVQLLLGVFVGLCSGAGVLVAQSYGAGDREAVDRQVHTALTLAAVGGAVLTVLGLAVSPWVMRFMRTPAEILDLSVLYLRIYFLGMVPQALYNMGTNLLRAVGDSRRPLYFLIISSLVNIGLDLLFVAVLPWGVAGAAAATVLSQCVSMVLTLRCLAGSQGMPWHLRAEKLRLERGVLEGICRIGLPGAAQSALYSVSNMLIQSAVNGFGTTSVAAWSVYGKIDFLFWMTVNSFGIAITTFAGQNFGARLYDRVRQGARTCLAMTAGCTAVMSTVMYLAAEPLFRLFSNDPGVIAQGVQMMHFLAPAYLTYITVEILSGTLRGCGDVRVPTLITVFGVCGLRVLWLAVALPRWHSMAAVEFSYPLTWVTASILFLFYYTKGGWMRRCIAARQAGAQNGT